MLYYAVLELLKICFSRTSPMNIAEAMLKTTGKECGYQNNRDILFRGTRSSVVDQILKKD